uniref:Uncharacterized protein n=1 Tax=Anguilla anguilla TaxID=7936 RepID=A0A0E9QZZ0_ANGAN
MHHHTALLFPKNHYCFSVLSIIARSPARYRSKLRKLPFLVAGPFRL